MENTHKKYDGFGSMGGSRTISMPVKVYNILNKYKSKFNKLLKNYIDDYLRYNVDDHEQMKFRLVYKENLNCDKYFYPGFKDFHFQWIVYNFEFDETDEACLKFKTSRLRWLGEGGYLFKIDITKKEKKILVYYQSEIYDYFRDLKYKIINSKDAYKYASDVF